MRTKTTFMLLEFAFLIAVFIVLTSTLSTADYFMATGLYAASVLFDGNDWPIELEVSNKSYNLSWVSTVIGLGFVLAFLIFIFKHLTIEIYWKVIILYTVSCAFSILRKS